MKDLENAETTYATSMLGKPLLLPMIMKKAEWHMLAMTRVKNLQRDIENPRMVISSSCASDCFRRHGAGNENMEGGLPAEKRPRPRKLVTNSMHIVPSAYLEAD